MNSSNAWVCGAAVGLVSLAIGAASIGRAQDASDGAVALQSGYGQVRLENYMDHAVDLYDDDGAFVCRALAKLGSNAQVVARSHVFTAQYTDGTVIGSIELTIDAGGTGVVTVTPR